VLLSLDARLEGAFPIAALAVFQVGAGQRWPPRPRLPAHPAQQPDGIPNSVLRLGLDSYFLPKLIQQCLLRLRLKALEVHRGDRLLVA
jgi:hypothetical protein